MEKTIKFKFECGETVTLTEINRPGIIDAVMFDGAVATYRVAHWNNGERKTSWVFASEITPKS